MEKLKIDQHISQKYNEELEAVRNLVLSMGGTVEQMLADAVRALVEGDIALSEHVRATDRKVNDLEMQIDDQCARVMARRQPAASDLRLLIATIKIVNDLERMGDQAEKVAILAARLSDQEPGTWGRRELEHVGQLVRRMVRDSLDAYARHDVELAYAVTRDDKKVDLEYEALTRQAITFMMEDPRTIRRSLDVLWSARAIERIGDHAKNVAEFVVYLVKGEDIRHAPHETDEGVDPPRMQ
jgi:phosphate transport system protein